MANRLQYPRNTPPAAPPKFMLSFSIPIEKFTQHWHRLVVLALDLDVLRLTLPGYSAWRAT